MFTLNLNVVCLNHHFYLLVREVSITKAHLEHDEWRIVIKTSSIQTIKIAWWSELLSTSSHRPCGLERWPKWSKWFTEFFLVLLEQFFHHIQVCWRVNVFCCEIWKDLSYFLFLSSYLIEFVLLEQQNFEFKLQLRAYLTQHPTCSFVHVRPTPEVLTDK